ncbi:MAG: hypothetical protein JWP87_4245 [Labilithrix sp.]|nr:hypothetical protein [Labilithrix sp.]
MRVGNWILLSLVVGVVLVSTGCKPKVGAKCKPGAVVCTKEGALFCGDDNKYVAEGCHGPAGCAGTGTQASCDNTLALAGESCEIEGNIACAVDKKAQLDCKNHKWVVGATCKGAKGCEFRDEELFCDHTLADTNDACHRDGQIACTNDRALILKCQSNVFTPVDTCKGPKSCTFQEHPERDLVEFDCDDSFANEGDPCNSEGFFACAVDKKSIHTCRSKKFSLVKTCPGPKGCTVDPDGQRLHCDQGSGGIFSGTGGGGKISAAAGGEKGVKAKPGASASAVAVKAAGSTSAAASASAKPAASASASAAASASGKPAGSASASPSAAASASAKPGASAKPVATAIKKR